MYPRLYVTLVVLLSVGGSLAAADKRADPIDPKRLVGRWESKGQEGSLVTEFSKDGKLVVVITDQQGKEVDRFNGTYRPDGNRLSFTLNGVSSTVTVTKLT